MRTDNIGIFWQDLPTSRKHGERVLGPMPPIPETGWVTPRDFPNIGKAPIIGIDVETYDPQLKQNGPGWARRRGNATKRTKGVPDYLHPVGSLVGVSVSAYGQAWYFPMRHTIHPETNMDPRHVLTWLNDVLSGQQPKVGTNLIYDVGWLQEEGVTVNGLLLDISHAEALLSETNSLSLDAIAQKYLNVGKETNLLYQWCSDWYGGSTKDQRKNIWRAPASLVGHYAEGDALLPMRAFEIQKQLLKNDGLYEVFEMECRLTRLLLAMRTRGVRIDLGRAEEVDTILTKSIHKTQLELDSMAGTEININSGASIAIAFDKFGLEYPMTPRTEKPSFKKIFLESVKHPISNLVQEVRHHRKLRDTFIRSYIIDSHVDGRIYGQFHAMRNEEYGTRSGRLSSSNPNLQNIPIRTKEGAMIRSCFVPEYGAEWLRYDYSQIEYRLLLHYAVGEGVEQTIQMYHDNPYLNYHKEVQRKLHVMTNRDIPYKTTKNINFGLIYGMGFDTLRRELQLTKAEAKALFSDYHESVPYVKETMKYYSNLTQKQGYIQTLLGRRSRFDLWESTNYMERSHPLEFDAAISAYGSAIQRASLHKSLNRLLQGSAADIIKRAMLVCYEDGLFNGGQLPMLTVHDELDFSAYNLHDPVWGLIRNVMEEFIQIRVPIRTEVEFGPNWGQLKKFV